MATMSQPSVQPRASNPNSTHPFTCNTCQVAFRSSELQRAHMQTDWHRYNLKRRVASLPPLTSEVFTEKVLANKASAAATAAKASFEKLCTACQRTYYSENAYQNHLNSQKHKLNVVKQNKAGPGVVEEDAASVMSSAFSLGEPMEIKKPPEIKDKAALEEFSKVVDEFDKTSLEDDDPVSRRPSRPHHSSSSIEIDRPEHPLSPVKTQETSSNNSEGPILTCLFCNFRSPTFPLNLLHMSRYHSMFIPEQEYLTDAEGLVGYLHAKITQGHECLYCGKAAHTAAGIQTHMRDRGHCMIAFDSEEEMLEVGEFYDFTSTWSDKGGNGSSDEWEDANDTDDTASTEGGGVKLTSHSKTKDAAATGVGDDGWETSSSVSSVPTDELTAVPLADRSNAYARLGHHRHHSHADPRPHRAADGFHSHAHATPHAVYHDEYELHLPSGRTAGHRSLRVYFRQNLRNYPSAEERAEKQQQAIEAARADEDGDIDMDADEAALRVNPNERNRNRQVASRANGGMGLALASDAQKREARATERRERRREGKERTRFRAGNEKRANFQKHFRDPLLQ